MYSIRVCLINPPNIYPSQTCLIPISNSFKYKYDQEIFIRVTRAVSFFLRLLIFNLQLLPQNPHVHSIVFVEKHTIFWMKNWTHALYHYFSFFVAIHRGQDSIIVPASLRHSRHSTHAYFAQTSKTQSRKVMIRFNIFLTNSCINCFQQKKNNLTAMNKCVRYVNPLRNISLVNKVRR